MRLNEIGEKRLLQHLLPQLAKHPRFLNGFGHDAAVVELDKSSDTVLVTKIDRAAQPMATRRHWTDFRMWGQLAVTATCSDLLAAGATPSAFMLAMILPGDFEVAAAEQIVFGCAQECEKHGVAFVGGDTKEGGEAQLVGCGFGTAQHEATHGRDGAQPGDVIVVAGDLGGYLGAYLQMIEASTEAKPDEWDQWRDYVTQPAAMWAEGLFMNTAARITAAMDASDGIYDVLHELAGPYGVVIREADLPYHKFALSCAEKKDVSPLALALGVGDWNIVYILHREDWKSVEAEAMRRDLKLRCIGEIVDSPSISVIDADGRPHTLRAVVNEHFAKRQEDEGEYLSFIKKGPYAD
jgi:thiamine-monophosphate kinase